MIKRIITTIRYLIMIKLMKFLTPHLFRKIKSINDLWYFDSHISGTLESISNVPRPSILFMERYFKNKKVSGLELGVQSGLNSISILNRLNIQKLYLVDAWTDYIHDKYTFEIQYKYYLSTMKTFQDNDKTCIIKGLSEIISKHFVDNSLDFIYLDANHSYAFIYQDLCSWGKKVKTGGVISGHDVFNCPDVLSAVKKWSNDNHYNFYIIPPDFYIIKLKKLYKTNDPNYGN